MDKLNDFSNQGGIPVDDIQDSQQNPHTPETGGQHPEPPLNPLWFKRSEDDVAYQRSAQVTWWTLMGGIALGALLTQFDALLSAMQGGNWHLILYFFATCFVIVNSWIQTAWGALVLCWPLSVVSSLILFFGNLACSIAALSITQPIRWYTSVVLVILFAVLQQLYFKRQGGWLTLPSQVVQRAKTGIFIYSGLIVIILLMLTLMIMLPGQPLEMAFAIVAFVFSVVALCWQHQGMQIEKKAMHLP
jgi:hypothetical protein